MLLTLIGCTRLSSSKQYMKNKMKQDRMYFKLRTLLAVLILVLLVYPTQLTAQPRLPKVQKDFLEAIANDNQALVSRLIIEGVELNPQCLGENHTCKPLTIAIEQSSVSIIRQLIKAGADQNARNPYGRRPLHYALNTARPDRKDVLLTLLKMGADPNVPNDFGISAFMEACFNGDLEIMRSMLDDAIFRAEVNFSATNRTNAQKPSHTTPLMQAAGRCHVEVIKLLLKRGADPSKKNSWGMTAADYATRFCADNQRQIEILSLLREDPAAKRTP